MSEEFFSVSPEESPLREEASGSGVGAWANDSLSRIIVWEIIDTVTGESRYFYEPVQSGGEMT